MVAHKLRKDVDREIKSSTVKWLIKTARERIVARYHIPVEEYKGEQISWYEYVMRAKSFDKSGAPAKMCDRLRAAERLDALLNLENISNDDPAEQAKKIHEFLRAAEATVGQEQETTDTSKDTEQGDASKDSSITTNEEQCDERESKSG